MKRLIFYVVMTTLSLSSVAQQLDGYNSVFLNSQTDNQWGLDDRITESFTKKGFTVFKNKEQIPKNKKERLATLELTYDFEIKYGGSPFHFTLTNMLGEKVFEAEGMGNTFSAKADANRACQRALNKMEQLPYKFDPSKTPQLQIAESDKSSWGEEKIKQFLLSSSDHFEGIYKNVGGNYFKLAFLKKGNKYLAIVLETDNENWYKGDVKAEFEHLKENYYNTKYLLDNYKILDTISEINSNGVIVIGEYKYMKIFPVNN